MFSEYALALALMAFFATSVDDFCVLLIFFSREYAKTEDLGDQETQRAFTNICIGQFVGFTIIVCVSLAIGIGLSQTVDEDWIDLIGFIPILIGMYLIYELMTEAGYFDQCCLENRKNDDDDDEIRAVVDENSPLVPPGDDVVGKTPTKTKKHVSIDDPKEHMTTHSDEEQGAAAATTETPVPTPTKVHKKVGFDDESKEPPKDIEAADGGGSGSGNSNGNSSSGGGGFVRAERSHSTDEHSENEEKPKPRPKPKRKRTLSADLSGRYFESLNDRIDVSNALGEAMGDSKNGKSHTVGKWITCFLDPLSQEVILYVLIFGIDNLAIFTVLFANVTEIEIVVVVVVFYAMLFFYIALTIIVLLQCPNVGHYFGNYVRYLVPFVLIGFGIYILYGSVIWNPNEE